jgi:hypothetical protein
MQANRSRLAASQVAYLVWRTSPDLRVWNQLSIGPVSQQLTLRLIDARMPFGFSIL